MTHRNDWWLIPLALAALVLLLGTALRWVGG